MNNQLLRNITVLVWIVITGTLGACATAQHRDTAGADTDPFEPANRGLFDLNETLDKYLVKPAAETYAGIMPRTARTGVTNFFSNIYPAQSDYLPVRYSVLSGDRVGID